MKKNPRYMSLSELIQLMHEHADELHMTPREREWTKMCMTTTYTLKSIYRTETCYLINNFAPLLYESKPLQP